MRSSSAVLTALLLASAARAGQPSPPAGPVPVPYPNTSTTTAAFVSPRDAASGQATGKRTHKPLRARAYYDQSVKLGDGRVFLVNTKTGEVEFGDGTKGDTPPTGEVPRDGKYRLGGGAAGNVEVRAGRLVTSSPAPTPAPIRAKTHVK